MLGTVWHWLVVVGSIANILACWWLLRWSARTKVNSDNETTGHTWDEDLQELNTPTTSMVAWIILYLDCFQSCLSGFIPRSG